jgi:hypothetical protein
MAETKGEWDGNKGERGMWVKYRIPGRINENGGTNEKSEKHQR